MWLESRLIYVHVLETRDSCCRTYDGARPRPLRPQSLISPPAATTNPPIPQSCKIFPSSPLGQVHSAPHVPAWTDGYSRPLPAWPEHRTRTQRFPHPKCLKLTLADTVLTAEGGGTRLEAQTAEAEGCTADCRLPTAGHITHPAFLILTKSKAAGLGWPLPSLSSAILPIPASCPRPRHLASHNG